MWFKQVTKFEKVANILTLAISDAEATQFKIGALDYRDFYLISPI